MAAFAGMTQDVDGRVKPGHDESRVGKAQRAHRHFGGQRQILSRYRFAT
jgi:hypothetical protein